MRRGRRQRRGSNVNGKKERVDRAESKKDNEDNSWATVVKRRPQALQTTRYPAHWKGKIVDAQEFVTKAANAKVGEHFVCGVLGEAPAELDGLMVPSGTTATVVLLPEVETSFETQDISAPAACPRGSVRIHRLKYLQIGKSEFPLSWKPAVVEARIKPVETTTIRAQLFERFLGDKGWQELRSRPRSDLKIRVLSLPRIAPDDLIDMFDYRSSEDYGDRRGMISCTLRVKKDSVEKFTKVSRHRGLLVKCLDAADNVQWLRQGPRLATSSG